MSLVNVSTRTKDGEKKPTRYYSSRQEKQVAKELEGKQQKNSGATTFDKGDVVTEQFLLEMKTKVQPSESMTIKKDWLDKNAKEALFIGKPYNALCFNFGPDQENYYIIDQYLFEELIDYLKTK